MYIVYFAFKFALSEAKLKSHWENADGQIVFCCLGNHKEGNGNYVNESGYAKIFRLN